MRRQTRASGHGRALRQTGTSSGRSNSGPDLVSLMRDLASDEKTGVNASLGFTYQHWYAALLAIERLGVMDDYLIILEFKEDVVIVDSPEQPSRVEFHQVKKNERSGIWTLNELLATGTKKSGEKTMSTMAKLVMRRHNFHPHPTVLWFASNVGFKLPLEEGETPRMTHDANLLDLCDSELATLRAALAKELDVDEDSIVLDDCFARLDAEVHDYEILEDVKSELVRVCADLTDRTNIELRAVCIALAKARDAFKQAQKRFRLLGEQMEAIVYDAEKASPELCGSYTLGYLHCLALLIIKNATDILIFTAAPSAQQEVKK